MKKSVISLSLASALLLTSTAAFAAADVPGSDAISITTALEKLQAKGYVAVKEVVFKDGVYQAKVLNADGQNSDVKVSAGNGEVVPEKAEGLRLNMITASEKVIAAGYHNIYEIQSTKNFYEVKALDKSDKKINLKVNSETGAVKVD